MKKNKKKQIGKLCNLSDKINKIDIYIKNNNSQYKYYFDEYVRIINLTNLYAMSVLNYNNIL
jgi:uncharacterized membrane protein YqgA involved in biofilm formation